MVNYNATLWVFDLNVYFQLWGEGGGGGGKCILKPLYLVVYAELDNEGVFYSILHD